MVVFIWLMRCLKFGSFLIKKYISFVFELLMPHMGTLRTLSAPEHHWDHPAWCQGAQADVCSCSSLPGWGMPERQQDSVGSCQLEIGMVRKRHEPAAEMEGPVCQGIMELSGCSPTSLPSPAPEHR